MGWDERWGRGEGSRDRVGGQMGKRDRGIGTNLIWLFHPPGRGGRGSEV